MEKGKELEIPFIEGGVSAGFPSPAQDYISNGIDLNQELIKHPSSTFFARVKGDSMINAGIADGDLLVVDKAVEPVEGSMVVAFLNGEFVLKRLHLEQESVWLIPENEKYKPIKVTAESDFLVWGVVTYVIKRVG